MRLIPGYNVDALDIPVGMRELAAYGYDDPHTVMVIEYALARWARGEEEQAQRGAIDQSFHGVSLTCWIRVLAAARAGVSTVRPTAAKKGRVQMPESLKEMLLSGPDDPHAPVDPLLKELIRKWDEPEPSALQVLHVLDMAVHGALASDFVISVLQIVYNTRLSKEGKTHEQLVPLATWRGDI